MENFLLDNGLPALFLLSLLAATLLPLGSEWLLVALILQGLPLTQVIAVATFGNVLGAFITYGIGLWGSELFMRKLLRVDKKQTARAMELYQRYGAISLLFAWLPIIGDPLCLAAGILRLQPLLFLFLVFLGKLSRYILIAMVADMHI
ncbi:MAG: VTT domain-containing protein [Proteobacteria bacterium]|nr:VTT domain-containing protein [Pseudomonadota bacterium]MBU1138578.1 VTT domain-containing protein [Pseudomonadota bacterium]MBU1233156.1 VTT domain-containing protein [Pseudomonadota bacterium]MBU1417988.1 VTT domain-containing protein [Pseudomonadota bacterium]MBU1454524.1 VTT domain-containing protein [Pseudomonadota bacterium]